MFKSKIDMNTNDKYFNRPPSEWHSLKSIANTETSQRCEKALSLLDLYTRQVLKYKTKVKRWKIESAQQIASVNDESIRGKTDNRKHKKIEDYFPRSNATAHLPSQNELTHLPSQNELTHLLSQDELIQENSENQFRFDREISPSISTMDSSYLLSPSSSTVDEEFIKTLHAISLWIVNNIDISEKCVKYHRLVIEKCKAMTITLNAIEELALSHIFVFEEENLQGLWDYFDDKLWKEIFTEF
ncbi:11751_t:CDS:2 [Gigaspora margarita]|uniref:11751_t:CDS:1 n=1 Tax=Gigaspora margarita TaxID=4874 RepID=A0ABN7UUS5_GIGMA|nr:11751_t:CDS:2 [Gigaspora margarita]